MKRDRRSAGRAGGAAQGPSQRGPSQRQLRAGELVRHALVEILREEDLHDEAMAGASVTVTEVRLSPDFKHAICFVESLGGVHADQIVDALNRHSKFIRGCLGRTIDLRFTPALKFMHDESFEAAARMAAVFNRPEVSRDLQSSPPGGAVGEADGGGQSAPDSPPSAASRPLPPGGGD